MCYSKYFSFSRSKKVFFLGHEWIRKYMANKPTTETSEALVINKQFQWDCAFAKTDMYSNRSRNTKDGENVTTRSLARPFFFATRVRHSKQAVHYKVCHFGEREEECEKNNVTNRPSSFPKCDSYKREEKKIKVGKGKERESFLSVSQNLHFWARSSSRSFPTSWIPPWNSSMYVYYV